MAGRRSGGRGYRSRVPGLHVDAATLRFLERHETMAHAAAMREVIEFEDALVLIDPNDAEPFWNRAASLRFPSDPEAFDRRLTELLALFAIRDRRPHIWPSAAFNQPADLVARLLAAGFQDTGGGWFMVLADPTRAPSITPGELTPDVTLDMLHLEDDPLAVAPAVATVLADAFATDPWRGDDIATDVAIALRDPAIRLYLARVDGEPAALAKSTTFDGASYLSSIGTRDRFQGRGLGSWVTRAAIADALANGAQWIYLGVFDQNYRAVRLYQRLGFVPVGEVAPDLLLA
jgi:ribosomal protein S18 acetylase RimI-like enzyme